jgi:hypothetical protein
MRLYKEAGDIRAAWSSYLDEFCRVTRPRLGWRKETDCIVPLVLTYLGIMDGSSDVERNFAQLTLLECRRSRRHHGEQFLQDLLKVRLHIPPEFRETTLGQAQWSQTVSAFLQRAQSQYAEFFGHRRLASRSMDPVLPEDKMRLLKMRRPRWRNLCLKSARTGAARREIWDVDVRRMLEDNKASVGRGSSTERLVEDTTSKDDDGLLEKAARCVTKKRIEHELYQREQERLGHLTCPPPKVQSRHLLEEPAKKKPRLGSGICSTLAPQAMAKPAVSISRAGRLKLKARARMKAPSAFDGIAFPDHVRVFFSAAAVSKHKHCAAHLVRMGKAVPEASEATHRIYASRADRATMPKSGPPLVTLSAFLHEVRQQAVDA